MDSEAVVGRARLSSRLTGTLQIAPMLVWVVTCYLLMWLLLHGFLALHSLAASGVLPTLHRLLVALVALAFLLLPAVAWWAAGLRKVATDGSNLLVTGGAPAAIPLAEVVDVSEWRASDLRTVRVTFGRETKFGRSIRFLAPTRFTVPRGEPHPVVLALRERVAAAQAEPAVRSFGRRVAGA